MFKIKKISNKTLLVSLSIFNIVMVLSFIFDLLLKSNLIPDKMIILAIPIELLSGNYLFVFSILGLEIFLIILILMRLKRNKPQTNETNEEFNFDFLTQNQLDDSENRNNLGLYKTNNQENHDTAMNTDFILEYNDIELESDSIENGYSEVIDNFEDIADDFDLSPSYLANFEEDKVDKSGLTVSEEIKNDSNSNQIPSPKEITNDYQFAIYQNIVNNSWLYEKARDRERVEFDHNAIDESQIPLSELYNLLKMGLIYKQTIQHPTGSFIVYSSNPKTEKQIINDYIRRICRKKRLRIINRKFDFLNFQEFGLLKKIWQFDFEIPESYVIGCIWTDDSFTISNTNMNILTEKKEELKALIAAVTLKMREEGTALIITNQKSNTDIIRNFIKKTGWGKANVLYFSDPKFEDKFTKFIEDNS